MIPESSEAGRVELWAAADFPTGWTRAAVLLEGVTAVDASVMRHVGMYWMWVNQSFEGGRLDDETFLYFSDRLRPAGPSSAEPGRIRRPAGTPAGRPFLHGETLIRPAQDCTGGYGSRVVFNAVEVMSTDDYREARGRWRRIGRPGAVSAPTPTPSTAPGRRRTAWDWSPRLRR